MASDIRISTELLDHPKTVKLERRLGLQGLKSLIALWLWCRENKPTGTLAGMDEEDIEIAAKWNGENGVLVNELLTLRWIDVNESLTENNGVATRMYSLHDWSDHNSWAVGSSDRSNAARFNRMAKTHPEIYENLKESGKCSVTSEEFQELTKNNEPLTVVKGALTPAPAPAPAPAPIDKATIEEQPRQKKKVTDDYRPDFISQDLWNDLIESRKFKKLSNSKIALKTFCNSILPAIEQGYTVESCIGEYAAAKWERFNVEWMAKTEAKKATSNCDSCDYRRRGVCKETKVNCASFKESSI